MTPLRAADLGQVFGYHGTQVDYLCNIGRSRGFLYFETPKVACTSIKRSLQLLERGAGGAPLAGVHDKRASPLQGALSSGMSFEDIFVSPRLFRFSFVRNPFSRALSCYLEKIVADEIERRRLLPALGFAPDASVSLVDFLRAIEAQDHAARDIHWRPQSDLLKDRDVHYHFIGRFEHLARDYRYALAQFGVSGEAAALPDLSPHRTNAGSRVAELLGPDEIDLVRRIYHDDFLRYGYSFDLPAA